jgi:GNAT superfamily N-acetyltransferase
MSLEFSNIAPKPEEYCQLRLDAGMTEKSRYSAEKSLGLSLFLISIKNSESKKLVGLGRVIGDYTAMQVADIIVHPDYQGQKLGKKIMGEVMNFVKNNADKTCFVNLYADVTFFYEKYGFVKPSSTQGMRLEWSKIL